MTVAIRDALDLQHGDRIRADVCIVGGGPAGISLALALAGTGAGVVLLESGGADEQTDDARDLNVGTNVGTPYYDLDETRHRALGGASQRWAGWCRPMDPADFDDRDWVAATGWPITYGEMRPFYDEAAELCEIDTAEPPVTPEELPAVYRPPFIGGGVDIATWQASPPTKFGRRYRGALESAPNIDVYTHATAVEVHTTADGTAATGVRVVTPAGDELTVEAPIVALCAGAIETARLLLASHATHANGLGNAFDLVGRYFMEHPHLVTARLIPLPPQLTGRPFVRGIDGGLSGTRDRLAMQRPAGSRKVAYVIDEKVRAKEGLLNYSTHIRTVSKVDREESDTYQAFKLIVNNLRSPSELARQIAGGSLPEGTGRQIGHLVRGLPELSQVIYQEALKRPDELALYTQAEQAPNPDSRVMIDPRDRDATGLPRVRLDWRLTSIDKASIVAVQEVLGRRFLESGLGVLVPEPWFRNGDEGWGPGLRGGHHHMGTARMADDPRHGVVDRTCRVHGVDGLYVGDSAVFPTSGYANPLLTTVAIARRLGAHLRSSAVDSR